MRIYVASSWRNERQPAIVEALRTAGHEVYDFKHPSTGGPAGTPGAAGARGFAWSEIDPLWMNWNAHAFREALDHPRAVEGFERDRDALDWCQVCVLLLPSGRSAHLEAGHAVGAGKALVVFLADGEPELMYRFAHRIVIDEEELLAELDRLASAQEASSGVLRAVQAEMTAELGAGDE